MIDVQRQDRQFVCRLAGIPFVLLCCLAVSAAQARSLSITVVGPQNKPLQYAAVQLYWSGGQAPAVPSTPLVMKQHNLRFIPHMMIVPVGSRVTFPNYDRTRHHVYSFSEARTFDIKLYVGLPDKPVTFDKTGVVTLGCNIHDQMQAFLIVTAAPRAGVTDENGQVVFSGLPDRAVQVSIWHPWMATEQERAVRRASADETRLDVQLQNIKPPPPSTRDDTLQQRFNALAG